MEYLITIILGATAFGGLLLALIQWEKTRRMKAAMLNEIMKEREINEKKEFFERVYDAGYRNGVFDERHKNDKIK